MKKHFAAITSTFLIAACQAEVVEVSLKDKDLQKALEGDEQSVEFEATFAAFGELDDAQRTQITALEGIVEKYLEVTDFELKTTDMGFQVVVEGEIPLTKNANVESAYLVHVTESDQISGYNLAQIKAGKTLENMIGEMTAINLMLAPDTFHPTDFRIKASGLDVLAPAVEVDGGSYFIWKNKIDGRIRLTFKGGAYDAVGAGFFFK